MLSTLWGRRDPEVNLGNGGIHDTTRVAIGTSAIFVAAYIDLASEFDAASTFHHSRLRTGFSGRPGASGWLPGCGEARSISIGNAAARDGCHPGDLPRRCSRRYRAGAI